MARNKRAVTCPTCKEAYVATDGHVCALPKETCENCLQEFYPKFPHTCNPRDVERADAIYEARRPGRRQGDNRNQVRGGRRSSGRGINPEKKRRHEGGKK